VWLIDGVITRQKHLDDFVIVIVRCQDEGGYVRRELAFLLRSV